MGHKAGKITAPVNTDDVREVLGENTDDIGTLCMSDKINRWAKFKPLAIDQKEDITDAQRAQFGYGIRDIPFFTNPYNMAMLIYEESLRQDNGVPILNEYFTYARPYEAMLKRLPDFAGYDHNALPPIFAPDEDEFQLGSDTDLTISFGVNKSTNHVELFDLSLFPSGAPTHLKDYYFGAVITDGEMYDTAIQQTPVSALYLNMGNVTFNYNSISAMINNPVALCAILSPVASLSATTDDKPYVPLLFALKTITLNYFPVAGKDLLFGLTAWRATPTTPYINVRYSVSSRSKVAWTVSPELAIRDSDTAVLLTYTDEDIEVPRQQGVTRNLQIPCTDSRAANVIVSFSIGNRVIGGISNNIIQGTPTNI